MKKTVSERPKKKKKVKKNVSNDVIQGKIGKIYIPDQQLGGNRGTRKLSHNAAAKGWKRQHRERKAAKAKANKEKSMPQESKKPNVVVDAE